MSSIQSKLEVAHDYMLTIFITITSIMSNKLRVACLHGYGTNAKFLERQMRSFRKEFDKEIEFVFLEGTHHAPEGFILDQKVINMINGETRSWNPVASYKYNEQPYCAQIANAFSKYFGEQRYDGLIGFSQGAVMIHLLLVLQRSGNINLKGLQNLKFCILACGNYWEWSELKIDNSSALQIPSIHLVSAVDFLYRKSLFTTVKFKNPLVIHHSFGHSFPRLGAEEFAQIRKYIREATSQARKEKKALMTSLL